MIKRIWKKIRGYTPLSLLVFVMIMMATPVFAAYNYVIPIQVYNNSTTSYTNLPILVSLDNDQLVTEGFMSATGLDTDVQEGASVPFSVVDDKLGIFTTGLTASQSKSFADYLGFTPNATDYPLIIGVGGNITVSDDATLELGSNFTIEQIVFINTTAGAGKNLVYKEDAFRTYVSADTDVTSVIPASYLSPTSHNDPDAAWSNETNAYDDNTVTYAYDDTPLSSWSSFIELNAGGLSTTAIRHYSSGESADVNEIDIDAYYDGVWNDVYSGAFVQSVWEEKDLPGDFHDVTAARVRYYNDFNITDRECRLNELFLVSQEIEVVASGITTGEHTIKTTTDGTDLKIYVDGVEEDTMVSNGIPVLDNVNDWAIMENDVLLYMDSMTIDVSLVQQLWYQPVTIIQTSTAVDRSGVGNHGTITWGTNPAGIEITVQAAISAADYFAATDGTSIPSPLPIPSDFEITATNTTGIADFWLYGLVNRAALSLGFSAQTMYVIIGLIAATGVGFGALIGTGNMLGFTIGFGATAALFAATGVMPWWVIIIVIAIVGMGIYTWRRS